MTLPAPPAFLAAVPAPQLPPASLRQHLMVVLAGKLAGETGVCEHGLVLACRWLAGYPGPHPTGSSAQACAGHRPGYPFGAAAAAGKTTHKRRSGARAGWPG
jgi:hypothetical protein